MHGGNTDPKARPEKKTSCTLRKIPFVVLHLKGCILFSTKLTNWCGSSRKLVSNFPTCCSNETGKQRRTRVELTNKRIYSHLDMPKALQSHIQTLSNAVIFHFPMVRCTIKIKIIVIVICLSTISACPDRESVPVYFRKPLHARVKRMESREPLSCNFLFILRNSWFVSNFLTLQRT